MATYDRPTRMHYNFNGLSGAAGNVDRKIQSPLAGQRGRIIEVEAYVTTLFTNVTTSAKFNIGATSGATTYFTYDMAASAAGTMIPGATMRSGIVGITSNPQTELPADTAIFCTLVAPTGGTPAGIADFRVLVDWG
jgi:hypothetical protein